MAAVPEVPLVLVTGASGFIATHLIQQLLQRGKERVRGTVRSLKNESKNTVLRSIVQNPKYELELVEADLSNEESWQTAVQGCTYVYHVASPFPVGVPADENEIIQPAVNGTISVLKAVVAAGGVKRVVITSSIAAITGLEPNASYSEKDWAPTTGNIGAYQKSKALAEKAAWDFVSKLEEKDKFELSVVNPALVIGPLLTESGKTSTSMLTVLKLLNSEVPALVDVNFNFVDVRDVAAGHIAAMETKEAVDNRHILVSSVLSMKEMSEIISNEFRPQGYRIPSFVMPKFGVWVYKAFDPAVRQVYPMIGRKTVYSNERMTQVLGIQPKDPMESIIDACYSLIEIGVVPKKAGYHGPPPTSAATVDTTTTEVEGNTNDGVEDTAGNDTSEHQMKEQETEQHQEELQLSEVEKQEDNKKQDRDEPQLSEEDNNKQLENNEVSKEDQENTQEQGSKEQDD